jgi:hypothetical protein
MSPVTRYVTKLAAIGICVLTSVLTIKIPTSEARLIAIFRGERVELF